MNDGTWDYIILMILSLALLGSALYLARYWKKHLKKKLESGELGKTRKEDVESSIATARTMLKLLAERGVDTTKAEALVVQAEMAADARLYSKADDYLKEAKEEALRANKAHQDGTDILKAPEPTGPVEESPKKVFEEFPPYYMQAKFEMKRAQDSIDNADVLGRDTVKARGFLDEAREHFEGKLYEKAFSMAVKARKSAEDNPVEYIAIIEDGEEDTEPESEAHLDVTISRGLEAEAKEAIACVTERMEGAEGEKFFEGKEGLRCPNCGAKIRKGDKFCRKCGLRLLFCPNCGAVVEEEDVFCGKCGYRLKYEEEVYVCPNCGAEVGPDDLFCPNCGASFQS